MKRREFLIAAGGAAATMSTPSPAATAAPATVLYDGRSIALTGTHTEGQDLWIHAADLERITEFEVRPEGACRGDVCIPIPKALKKGASLNLTGFAHRVHQAVAADAGVWSLGLIPAMRGTFLESRIAPDFAIPDRSGRIIHLRDFRGKKVLLVTWASW
jgi:hypothetical protein